MSHFCTIVIVPIGASVDEKVTNLLAPYDEDIQVDPYNTKCHCVGGEARRSSIDFSTEKLGSLDTNERASYHKDLNDKCIELAGGLKKWKEACASEDCGWSIQEKAEKLITPWGERIASRVALEEKYEKEHPLYNKAHPNCKDCKGSGIQITQYNPKSKWDWWTIGGRWNADLQEEYDPRSDPDNFETCFICNGTGMRNDNLGIEARKQDPNYSCNSCHGKGKILKYSGDWLDKGGNIVPVSKIPKNYLPYAIVTPDGEWHEKGEMGWFGLSSNEKDSKEWENICKGIFSKYAEEYLAVVVDCHI